MNEININIEGFNVNGICVGCLNYNRKMFYSDDVKECFRLIGNIDVPDGLTIQVCWECLAYVRTVQRFQKQMLHSFYTLMEYSRKHTFLNSPTDLSSYATQRLTIKTIKMDIGEAGQIANRDVLEMDVKTEDEDVPEYAEEERTKQELDLEEFLEDATSVSAGDEFCVQVDTKAEDSDDVQLSELKQKKQKKDRKKRGRKPKKPATSESPAAPPRKLRNLPAELVEPVTLSEADMWGARARDAASEEFLRMRHTCSRCVLAFVSRKLLDAHTLKKHQPKGDNSVMCDVCGCHLVTREHVAPHRALHRAAYRCRACGHLATNTRLMRAHLHAHRQALHACTLCGDTFSTKSKLTYHRGVCLQEKPQCDCCGKVFANKMTLKYHLKILPANPAKKDKDKESFPCKGCDKVFPSKKSYRAHVVIHDGIKYPCPVCGKMFQWKRNLARHARAHRDRERGDTHHCADCGKVFASVDCYNNHMRLSKRHARTDTYAHECSYCGKRFPTRWCMVDHVDWEHLKKIKYQCQHCNKPFKTAKIMVAHVNNIHRGRRKEVESEHLCDICGKSYKTEKRLKGHVWAMHTKRSTTKSFKCKLCPATFTWQTSIYKHVKMMHDQNKRKPQRMLPSKKDDLYTLAMTHKKEVYPAATPSAAPVQPPMQPLKKEDLYPLAMVHKKEMYANQVTSAPPAPPTQPLEKLDPYILKLEQSYPQQMQDKLHVRTLGAEWY